MNRILAMSLFAAVICVASEAQAQHARRIFTRNTVPQQNWINRQSHIQPYKFEASQYSQKRYPTLSRILDGQLTKYRDPAEVDSRYIGGFHQNHFDNLGIPSGDIGIRGNALNWRF